VLPQPVHQWRIALRIAFLKFAWKISVTNSVRLTVSEGSKGGSSMEDQDRETRGDEDVEAHGPAKTAPAWNAPALTHGDDDEDDVEAHGPAKTAPAWNAPALTHGDDDDDVEGHGPAKT
jgi:hypothetical protein